MGVIIPNLLTEDRVSGAQIVDGSLRFNGTNQYLTRTFSTPTSSTLYTFSFWVKRSLITSSTDYRGILSATNAGDNYGYIDFSDNGIRWANRPPSGTIGVFQTTPVYRDASAWYHMCLVYDSAQATDANKVKLYVNNTQVTTFGTFTAPSSSQNSIINSAITHYIGYDSGNTGYFSGLLSQVYLIDGQALGPEYFGYTDPLTNTWRPKKLSSSVAFGTNGFYLPFDGNSPIGQDQSGNGNNWTPVNFGGSNTLEKATGALPILNTDGGGKVARVGVRTDSNASSLVLALPLVGIRSDYSNKVNGGTTEKVVTNTGTADASNAQSIFYGGSFYFDGTNDYLSIPNNSDFNPGTGDFTIECWIYPTAASGNGRMIASHGGTAFGDQPGWSLFLRTDQKIQLYSQSTPYPGTTNNLISTNTIQLNTWNHIAVTRNGSTQRIFLNGILDNSNSSSLNIGTTYPFYLGRSQGLNGEYWSRYSGYVNDFRFYKGTAKYTQNFIPASTDPDILPDTPSGVSYSSNVTAITDGAVTTTDAGNNYLSIAESEDFNFGTGDFTIEGYFYINSSGSNNCIFDLRDAGSSSQYFLRMTSATAYDFRYSGSSLGTFTASDKVWNHIAISRSSGTTKIFVNGVQTNSFSDTNNASNTGPLIISSFNDTTGSSSSFGFNGFISNFQVVKGTALYTSNFTPPTGPLTDVTNTKLLCCKSPTSATAFDVSPGTITSVNALATNFNPFTVNINAVRGQESGYCTFNPLDKDSGNTVLNGNLTVNTSSAGQGFQRATMYVSSGKWYWEVTVTNIAGNAFTGIAGPNTIANTTNYIGATADSYGYVASNGNKYNNSASASYGATYTSNDVIGVALDLDVGTLIFYKNGVSQGTAYSSLSGSFSPAVSDASDSGGSVIVANFGQKPFKFPPPTGFQPLALANTPRPTIVRPDQYVGVTTFTGTGQGTTTTVSNLQFKPDFVWTKSRAGIRNHGLYDSVRGINRKLYSSATFAENTGTTLTSFDSNGFKLADGDDIVYYGESGVAWCWKAGGNSNTYNIDDVGYATASAAGLDGGSGITLTGASVGTKQGFSILRYTGGASGSTLSHGLTQAPDFWIIKNLSGSTQGTAGPHWYTKHKDISGGKTGNNSLFLNLTNGESDGPHGICRTSGDSLFEFVDGYAADVNWHTHDSAATYICYAWHSVPGFSKFGTFTGNLSVDGPVVITGFRPRWILLKRTDTTGNWILFDSVRDTFNFGDRMLFPNSSSAETQLGSDRIDILSNGFKMRSDGGASNGGTMIYAAFAETPTFNLYGAQSNAR